MEGWLPGSRAERSTAVPEGEFKPLSDNDMQRIHSRRAPLLRALIHGRIPDSDVQGTGRGRLAG
jgi:hypothetical protein